MSRPVKLAEISACLGAELEELSAGAATHAVRRGAPASEAGPEEFSFIMRTVRGVESLLQNTRTGLLLVEPDMTLPRETLRANGVRALLTVPNARLAFVRVLNAFFTPRFPLGFRHPSADIDAAAEIHPDTYIGPFCQIGSNNQ